MPPVDHGRFTLNVDLSVVRRDNSARYDRVALDEWDTRSGEHVRTIDVQLAGTDARERPAPPDRRVEQRANPSPLRRLTHYRTAAGRSGAIACSRPSTARSTA